MSQNKKNKLKSIKKSLELVYAEVQKHVETNDPKILALPDYGLILGTTQLLMEEEIIKGNIDMISIPQPESLQIASKEAVMEKEFNKNDIVNTSSKKPTTFH